MITVRGPVALISDKRIFKIFGYVPRTVLHSNRNLNRVKYFYSGGIHQDDVKPDDILVTIDSDSFRIKNRDGIPRTIRNGTCGKKHDWDLKLCGLVTPGGQLFVVMEPAKPHLSDIGPHMPLRVSGIKEIKKIFPDTRQQELAV